MTVFELSNVTVRLGREAVLRRLNWNVPEGQAVALLGLGGSGKTTLLKALVGLAPVASGRIRYRGKALAEWDRPAYLREIGMTFQRGGLFDSMTAAQNLSFALTSRDPSLKQSPSELLERVEGLLESVGLGGKGPLYPYEMSGGMQKRLGIARAAANDPKVLLLDEPTAGLDPVTGREILKTVAVLRERTGMTCIMVTNDLNAARRECGAVAYLSEGRLAVEGPWTDFDRSESEEVKDFIRNTRWETERR